MSATPAPPVPYLLTTFLAGLALGQLVFGPLSDRYGQRSPILLGAAVCTLATLACALAPSLGWLAVLRFVQGFSGAAGVVIGRAVVADVARGAAAARLLAAASLVMLAGCVHRHPGEPPEGTPPARRRPRDGRDIRQVLADRPYVGYTLSFSFGMLFCWIAGSPFLLQNVLELGVGVSSVVFSCGALTATAASAAGAKLVIRYGAAALLRCGLRTVCAGTLALFACAVSATLALVPVLLLLGLVCEAFGLVIGNAAALAIERVPQAAGAGSAVLGTLQSALGAAVAPLVGLGGAHTAVPLFTGMAASAALALASLRLAR